MKDDNIESPTLIKEHNQMLEFLKKRVNELTNEKNKFEK